MNPGTLPLIRLSHPPPRDCQPTFSRCVLLIKPVPRDRWGNSQREGQEMRELIGKQGALASGNRLMFLGQQSILLYFFFDRSNLSCAQIASTRFLVARPS